MELMKTKADPQTPSREEMRRMIAGLTPAERLTLKDPNFITEDEADLIMSDRAVNGPGPLISLDELFKENGQTRRKRRA